MHAQTSNPPRSNRTKEPFVAPTAILGGSLLALGLALRLHYAATNYLNPDEAMHIGIALSPDFSALYEQSNDITHPPLLLWLLWIWLALGSSELWARALLALSTIAAAALGYDWLRRRWSERAALFALLFGALSPASIAAGSEIRQAGLMLLFATGAPAALERSISSNRRRWLVVYTLCLMAAISTHYGASVLLFALGCYAPLRFQQAGCWRRLGLLWCFGQVLTLALCDGLLQFNPSGVEEAAGADYLAPFRYDPALQSGFRFVFDGTRGAFAHFAGNPALGAALGLLAFVGICRALRSTERRSDAVWFGLPFVLSILGALAGQMPWGDTRHVVGTLPVVGAAFGIGLDALLPRRPAVALAALVACASALYFGAITPPERLPRPPADLRAALDYIDRRLPARSLVLIDVQTYHLLRYYLRNEIGMDRPADEPKGRRRLHGRVDFAELGTWKLRTESWWLRAQAVLAEQRIPPGETIWVLSAGWWKPVDLVRAVPRTQRRRQRSFGALRLVEFVYLPPPRLE